MMEADYAPVVRAVLTAACSGDMAAARLVLERIAPARKGRPVAFPLPPVQSAADLPAAMAAVVQAVASGELTTDEASSIATVLEAQRRAIETAELAQRIARLEEVCGR
jgi:hypothetical protein